MKNPAFYRRKDGSFRTDEEAREYMEKLPLTPLPTGTNKEIERLQDMDKILRNENINLKLRINKAIEYIEHNYFITGRIEELHKILKGSDKE